MSDFTNMSDGDIGVHFVELTPPGRWSDYTEYAACVTAVTPGRQRNSPLNGWRMATLMLRLGSTHTPWHRCRNQEGVINPPNGHRDPEGERRRYAERLRAEGCPVTGGVAAGSQHITARELLALDGLDPGPAPREVLSAEAARRVAERVAERVERLNRR